ncbi:MAG: Fe3+/spermidine/putrescine ABC transporter ATP-binding protein, partial [Pseudomonadota bacterium]
MPKTDEGVFLRFDDVKKSYDQKTLVVKGFDMGVQEGEFIT